MLDAEAMMNQKAWWPFYSYVSLICSERERLLRKCFRVAVNYSRRQIGAASHNTDR